MKKFNFTGFYIRKPLTENQIIHAVSENKFKKLTDSDLLSCGFLPFHIEPYDILNAETDVFNDLNCYQHFDDLLLVKYTTASRYPSYAAVDAELATRLAAKTSEEIEYLSDEDMQNIRESITYELGKITPIRCTTMFCALDLINQRCYFATTNEKHIHSITSGLREALGGFHIQHFANSSDSHITDSLTDTLIGGYDRNDIDAPSSQILLEQKSFIDAKAMDYLEVGARAHLKSSDKDGPEHKLKNVCLRHKDYRQHLTDFCIDVVEIELGIFSGQRSDLDDPFTCIAGVLINNKWQFKGVELTDSFEAKWLEAAEKLTHFDYYLHDQLLQAMAMHKITASVLPAFKMPLTSIDDSLLDDETDVAATLMNAC